MLSVYDCYTREGKKEETTKLFLFVGTRVGEYQEMLRHIELGTSVTLSDGTVLSSDCYVAHRQGMSRLVATGFISPHPKARDPPDAKTVDRLCRTETRSRRPPPESRSR